MNKLASDDQVIVKTFTVKGPRRGHRMKIEGGLEAPKVSDGFRDDQGRPEAPG